jgi:demethylmenaquinone methyltransferase/2-methoxy-6-polyprenyl-1,4-benzoquinol methylase
MDDNVLKEQLDYYNARAGEYDQSLQGIGGSSTTQPEYEAAKQEWQQTVNGLHALGPLDEVLELACGTGIWTRELTRISRSVTVIDGSAEMISANRAKNGTATIKYQCLDLFQWEPDRQYDLVFFAFWLSHVPPSHLSSFLSKVARATKPDGRVFIVDEPKSDSNISGPNTEELYQQRTLSDGRSFRIVKVYYDPQEIERELEERGFKKESSMVGRTFFYLSLSC